MIAVNGTEITADAVRREMQYHPADRREDAHIAAARALVVRELLLQEARRRGIVAEALADESEEESLLRQLLAGEIQVPEPDDETCRRYFATHPENLRAPDSFEASHILLPASPSDPDARAEAKRQAGEIIAELAGDATRFAALAAARSACPSAANGGDLGTIGRGQTVPEFETFLYAVEPGQVCPTPVPTRYGYHVLYLRRRTLGSPPAYAHAKEAIAGYLRERCWREAVHQYIKILAGRAKVEGIDIAAAMTPLVQ
jgi:peptidyl-prolyl cis-trans isomerase C